MLFETTKGHVFYFFKVAEMTLSASIKFTQICPPAIFLLQRILLVVLPLLLPNDGSPVLPGPPIFEYISHYPSLCYLPPESGMCPPATNRTTNRSSKPAEARASLTLVEDAADGDEDAQRHVPLLTRYYFDVVTAQCYPFGAQTCGGNENRFDTQAQCLAKCRIDTEIDF
ncbi:hypothetical protein GPALN_003172 [Globodera pallida]|nr:hypothetical protein GPALN_003172 [Globodera pallida]